MTGTSEANLDRLRALPCCGSCRSACWIEISGEGFPT